MKPTFPKLLAAFALTVASSQLSLAQDAAQTRTEIENMIGFVPSFVGSVADSALPGLWQETAALEFSEDTALEPKVKALISLAVAAQIPCNYCIWSDTNSARQYGATDQEIAEAVAMAGLTRNWSTVFNGMQIDFDQFKKEMSGM